MESDSLIPNILWWLFFFIKPGFWQGGPTVWYLNKLNLPPLFLLSLRRICGFKKEKTKKTSSWDFFFLLFLRKHFYFFLLALLNAILGQATPFPRAHCPRLEHICLCRLGRGTAPCFSVGGSWTLQPAHDQMLCRTLGLSTSYTLISLLKVEVPQNLYHDDVAWSH